jgi:hypothetical protein
MICETVRWSLVLMQLVEVLPPRDESAPVRGGTVSRARGKMRKRW